MNDTPDAFAMLRDLIALAVDPAACRTRLAKLQKLLEQTAAAEQRLAERSAAFDQKSQPRKPLWMSARPGLTPEPTRSSAGKRSPIRSSSATGPIGSVARGRSQMA